MGQLHRTVRPFRSDGQRRRRFNSAVTPHAQEFGMQIHSLGPLPFLAGAAGRTASPIAGITILVAGLAKANPFDVAKRTFLPMVVAVILLASL